MFVSVKDSLSKGGGEGKVTSRPSKKSSKSIKVLQRNKDGNFRLVTLTGEAAAKHRASMAAKAERKKGNLELTEGLKGIGIPPSKVSPESRELLSGVPTERKVSDKPPIVAGKPSDPLSVAGKRINEKPALGRGGKGKVPTFRIRETISEGGGGGGVIESKKTPSKETVLRTLPRHAKSMFISAKDSLLKGNPMPGYEGRENLGYSSSQLKNLQNLAKLFHSGKLSSAEYNVAHKNIVPSEKLKTVLSLKPAPKKTVSRTPPKAALRGPQKRGPAEETRVKVHRPSKKVQTLSGFNAPEPALRGIQKQGIEPVPVAKSVLSTKKRAKLPRDDFAIRTKADDSEEKKESGNYPIPDLSHARNALAMVAQHGTPSEQAKVRAAVYKKYPELDKRKEEEEQEKSMFISARDRLDKSGGGIDHASKEGRTKLRGSILQTIAERKLKKHPDYKLLVQFFPNKLAKYRKMFEKLTGTREGQQKLTDFYNKSFAKKSQRLPNIPTEKKLSVVPKKNVDVQSYTAFKKGKKAATGLGAVGPIKEKSMFISAKDSLSKAVSSTPEEVKAQETLAGGQTTVSLAAGKDRPTSIPLKGQTIVSGKGKGKAKGKVTALPGVTLHAKGDKVTSSTYNPGKDGPKEKKVDIHEPQVITSLKRVTNRPPPKEVKKDMDDDETTLDKSFDPVRAARMNMKPMSTIGAMGNPVVGQVGFHNTTIGANFSKGLNVSFEEKKFPILRRPKR